MRRTTLLIRCSALLLATAFALLRLTAYNHANFTEPIQTHISQKAALDDDQSRPKLVYLKGKRFVADPFSFAVTVAPPLMDPNRASSTPAAPPLQLRPGCCRDIFIPPEARS